MYTTCKLRCCKCRACIHMYTYSCLDGVTHTTVCNYIWYSSKQICQGGVAQVTIQHFVVYFSVIQCMGTYPRYTLMIIVAVHMYDVVHCSLVYRRVLWGTLNWPQIHCERPNSYNQTNRHVPTTHFDSVNLHALLGNCYHQLKKVFCLSLYNKKYIIYYKHRCC